MSLSYAVDRLYETGWTWDEADAIDEAGRPYPDVAGVTAAFAAEGLRLSVRHVMTFDCYRAEWQPAGRLPTEADAAKGRHGVVIGATEAEAAVYALAQYRAGRLVVAR